MLRTRASNKLKLGNAMSPGSCFLHSIFLSILFFVFYIFFSRGLPRPGGLLSLPSELFLIAFCFLHALILRRSSVAFGAHHREGARRKKEKAL